MKNIDSIAEDSVRFGEKLGASEVEAYITTVDRKRIILKSEIESLNASIMSGIGVRIIIGKRSGFFATSSLEISDVRKAVERAYSIAKLSQPDKEWVSFTRKFGKTSVEQTFDKEIAEIEPSKLVEEAVHMINVVKTDNEKLSITRGDITAEIVETAIVNSHNCNLRREETFASASVSIKAEENGKKGVSSESQQARKWSELNSYLIAQTAAKRASKIMYARPMAGGKGPVVWHGKLFASVLNVMFGRTLSADSVQKRRSPWTGKVGKRIASEKFNLADEGLLRGGLGTREFDDDGIPQRKVTLIKHGILCGFLHDNYTANKEACNSTGNSGRSYRSLPTPSPNNLFLQSGKESEEELIEDVKRGLYVIETIGMWLSNPISGDISATATNAFLIENGELTKPVKGVIISGNLFDILLHNIDLIANDVQNLASTYSPSIRIADMTITVAR